MKNRPKLLRAEPDRSRAKLAKRPGVSRQAVNAIETGNHLPALPLALRIAALLNHDGAMRCPKGNKA